MKDIQERNASFIKESEAVQLGASYPKKGEGVLGNALSVSELKKNTPYIVKELNSNRMLCINGTSGNNQRAFLGDGGSYSEFVIPIVFDRDPSDGEVHITGTQGNPGDNPFRLGTDGGGNGENIYWGRSDFPDWFKSISFKLKSRGRYPDEGEYYVLAYTPFIADRYVYCGSGSWDWLRLNGSNEIFLTFHKFYYSASKIKDIIDITWPNAKISYQDYKTGDIYYEAVTNELASEIYSKSNLSSYKWVADKFDCDDFSYTYKAQSSREAYLDKSSKYGYAIGTVFGRSAKGGHAVNMFLDADLNVKIIEPQNGRIINGKDWEFIPYFILI